VTPFNDQQLNGCAAFQAREGSCAKLLTKDNDAADLDDTSIDDAASGDAVIDNVDAGIDNPHRDDAAVEHMDLVEPGHDDAHVYGGPASSLPPRPARHDRREAILDHPRPDDHNASDAVVSANLDHAGIDHAAAGDADFKEPDADVDHQDRDLAAVNHMDVVEADCDDAHAAHGRPGRCEAILDPPERDDHNASDAVVSAASANGARADGGRAPALACDPAPRRQPMKRERTLGQLEPDDSPAGVGREPVPARGRAPRGRPVKRESEVNPVERDVIDLTGDLEIERRPRVRNRRSASPARRFTGLWPAELQPPAGEPLGMREFCKRYHVARHICKLLVDAGYKHSGTLKFMKPHALAKLNLNAGETTQLQYAIERWAVPTPRGGDGSR
jgi:hypothetical protein